MIQGKRVGVALAALAAGLSAAPAAPAAQRGRKPVATASRKVRRHAADHGAVPKDRPVKLRVYLAPKGGEDALKAAVAAVADPSSPRLPALPDARAVPGPLRADRGTVASVSKWLEASGLKVTGTDEVPGGRAAPSQGT